MIYRGVVYFLWCWLWFNRYAKRVVPHVETISLAIWRNCLWCEDHHHRNCHKCLNSYNCCLFIWKVWLYLMLNHNLDVNSGLIPSIPYPTIDYLILSCYYKYYKNVLSLMKRMPNEQLFFPIKDYSDAYIYTMKAKMVDIYFLSFYLFARYQSFWPS